MRRRSWWTRWLGDRGERAAARHLRRQGMRVWARGYRIAQGEVDLIARDGPTVVFVEVKSRQAGTPAEAVTPGKQRRLTLAALHFLRKHGLLEARARFDVISILWPEGIRSPTVEHIRDAFPAVGHGQMFR